MLPLTILIIATVAYPLIGAVFVGAVVALRDDDEELPDGILPICLFFWPIVGFAVVGMAIVHGIKGGK